MLLVLLYLFIVILGAKAKGCKLSDGRYECLKKFNEIRNKTLTSNLTDDKVINDLFKSCQKFKACAPAMKCQAESKIVGYIDSMLTICDVIDFRHDPEFIECSGKIEARNSKCLREWNPFPDKVEDQAKRKQDQENACKNFFGKYNCMERETIEVCGVKLWDAQKKHFLALNSITKACKFD
ncbi:hypothetical protein CAEBREN_14584 [Caenorhabditis brenneri]|uniref:T20D4.11-like domain-containing protein n=1 Tax=Caenorhabditis brenneri TaxID=135651 RepID=G0MA09_CAEBE|nr:hypothetical protein CAEBREN_14584 [Caenorhabditis brenneri]